MAKKSMKRFSISVVVRFITIIIVPQMNNHDFPLPASSSASVWWIKPLPSRRGGLGPGPQNKDGSAIHGSRRFYLIYWTSMD